MKARKKKSEEVPEGMTASWRNQFLIVEILEEDAACPALEEVLAEYLRPVILSDEVLGELTLNKDLDLFDGDVSWRGERDLCISGGRFGLRGNMETSRSSDEDDAGGPGAVGP